MDILTRDMSNMRIKIRKVEQNNYDKYIKKYNINDKELIDYTEDESCYEYLTMKRIIYSIDKLNEKNINDYDIDDFILFEYARTLRLKKRACLNADDNKYKHIDKIAKNKIRIINRKVINNLLILNNNNISIVTKLFHIKKLNKAFINLLDCETKRKEELELKNITIKIKKIII